MKTFALFSILTFAAFGQAITGVSVTTPWVEYNATAGTSAIGDVFSNVEGRTRTTITAGTTAGVTTSLSVTTGTGIAVGSALYFKDASPETVTVSGSYVLGSTTVPLTAAVANTHSNGAAIEWVGGTSYGICDDCDIGAASGNLLFIKFAQTGVAPVVTVSKNPSAFLGTSNTLVGATGRTWKATNTYSLDGVLYTPICLQTRAGTGAGGLQTSINCSIMKSADYGASYSNPAGSSNTAPPTDGTAEFTGTMNASPFFVLFGPDGTCPVAVDSCATYVYAMSAYQKSNATSVWNNGDAMILMRALKSSDLQASASWEYNTGGSMALGTDTWSATAASARDIIVNTGKIGMNGVVYIPWRQRFLLFQWYYTVADATSNSSTTTWDVWEAPHLDGTWTKVSQMSQAYYGFYNPQVVHYTTNQSGTQALRYVTSGNFLDPGTGLLYGAWYAEVALDQQKTLQPGFPGNRYAIPINGLILYYSFDDALSAARISDRSGSGYTTSSVTPTAWSNGGGVSNYYNATAVTSAFTGQPSDFTFMVVYVRNSKGSPPVYERIIEKNNSGNAGIFLGRNNTTANTFGCGIGPTQTGISPYGFYSNTFTDGQTLHVITCRRAGIVQTLFSGPTDLSGSSNVGSNAMTNVALKLYSDGSSGLYGTLYRVMVWNRSVSNEELAVIVTALTRDLSSFGQTIN